MKKLVIALTALAAFTGSAVAADLGRSPYTKAAGARWLTAPSWTGFYIFGGGGGGIWSALTAACMTSVTARLHRLHQQQDVGGMAGSARWVPAMTGSTRRWVLGIFGDGTFGSLRGDISDRYLPRQSSGP